MKFEDGKTTLKLEAKYSSNYGYYYGLFFHSPLKSLYVGRNFIAYNGFLPNVVKRVLEELTIGNSVTEIASWFSGCSGLTSVIISNSVTRIGSSAFWDCSLTSLVIPEYVTSIGEDNCIALTSLYLLATYPPKISGGFCTRDKYITLNVFVPLEALSAYRYAEGWKNFWNLQAGAPTGMESLKNNNTNAKNNYYDLRGNKLNVPMRGLNIINGRKVMVK